MEKIKKITYKGTTLYEGEPTLDGRKYFFRKSKNGKQYTSKKYITKDECEKAKALFTLKNDNPINKRFDLVANDYFDELYKIKKDSTYKTYIDDYKRHIQPFFNSFNINSIKVSDMRKWAEILDKKGLSVNYMNKIRNILNNIFKFAMKNYSLEINPVQIYGRFQKKNDKIIKDEDKVRYITLDEFNRFISVIPDEELTYKTLFITLFYTGMRKGELQALTWNDINFNKNEININKTLYAKTSNAKSTSTKNNKNRIIKMSKTLKDSIIKYYNIQKGFTDFNFNWYVFGGPRFMPSTTIDRYKKKYFELSEVKEITIHEFRHSHVSLLINEYIKSGQTDTAKFFLMMSERMGHTIDVMQNVYMHLFPTIQDEIVNLLDNL